jgi:hypothetical protein
MFSFLTEYRFIKGLNDIILDASLDIPNKIRVIEKKKI